MMRKVTNNLPQMQSAPYVIVTNGADRFTLYSNFLPIDRCGEGDGAGDVEVVGEGAAVYLFGQGLSEQVWVGKFTKYHTTIQNMIMQMKAIRNGVSESIPCFEMFTMP